MTWTPNKPTHPGWYWVSSCVLVNPDAYPPPYAVQIIDTDGVLFANLYYDIDIAIGPMFTDAQWLGPIEAPVLPVETFEGADDGQ